ncbi:MAG: hypothetical protein SPE54_00210, partial [Sodaliphilus sp.]|nr:hypothetical protein [Sodaliphilus sp.]
TKSATCTNASPPNARTPPATKKRTPPIIESWECPYVISKKNGNIAPPADFFSAFDTLHPRQIANIQYGITIMGRT